MILIVVVVVVVVVVGGPPATTKVLCPWVAPAAQDRARETRAKRYAQCVFSDSVSKVLQKAI